MIPELDLIGLRSFCRLGEDDELPPPVVELYWRYKHTRDAYGASPVHPDVLAWIVFQALPQAPLPPPPFSIQTADVAVGDCVVVKWRGKECFAEFVELTGRNTAVVLLENEPAPREVQVADVLGIAEKV